MKAIIIGGGAAGMAGAVLLARKGVAVTLLERGGRLGRKLSATGNGQGNVTNLHMGAEHFFSDDRTKVSRILSRYPAEETVRFLESMGGIFLPDGRGRVYPCGRQASAVTDLFRREIARLGVSVLTGAQAEELSFRKGEFFAAGKFGKVCSDVVLLAAGGCAAPSFGTDGNAYALARAFGHTVIPPSPVLVQLTTEEPLRGLKGVRAETRVRLLRDGEEIAAEKGDLLFTDGGVSGDAIFRISSRAERGDLLLIDFLPDVSEERLRAVVREDGDLLCVVNNGLARAIVRRAGGDREKLLSFVKRFPMKVTGNLGFAHAQATRGGIPLAETDEFLMSVRQKGLSFAGEILNVDGECGGYNLHWAFASAARASEGILCD